MKRIELLRAKLRREGYLEIEELENDPNHLHDWHTHEGDKAVYVWSGSCRVYLKGKRSREYRAGQRYDIPAGVLHKVKAGPEGYIFIDATKYSMSTDVIVAERELQKEFQSVKDEHDDDLVGS